MKTGPKMQSSKSSHLCRLDDVHPRLDLVNVVVRPHTRIAGHSLALIPAARVPSSTNGIFHVEFRNLIQIVQTFCANGTNFFF